MRWRGSTRSFSRLLESQEDELEKNVQTYLDVVIRVLGFIDQYESGEKQDFIPYLLTRSKAELYSKLLGVTQAFFFFFLKECVRRGGLK